MSEKGTVVRTDERAVIRFERRLPHPPERVWSALTEPEELRRWWGDVETDLVEGGRFTIRWLNTDEKGKSLVMDAAITELDPPRALQVEGDPHGVLRFELEPQPGGGTLLTFTSTPDLPDEFRSRTLAGWHYHLDGLEAALDGGEVELHALPNPDWERIHESYAD